MTDQCPGGPPGRLAISCEESRNEASMLAFLRKEQPYGHLGGAVYGYLNLTGENHTALLFTLLRLESMGLATSRPLPGGDCLIFEAAHG